MAIYKIDPLCDPRWTEFLQNHPRASVFHTPGWLEALRRTHGYRPVVLSTFAPDRELRNGVVFCRVDSFLTGRRLVSVPFADHCEPLVDGPTDFEAILTSLQQDFQDRKYKYVEIRPRSLGWAPRTVFTACALFWFHTLDLRPDAEQLLRSFGKSSVQRSIRRADRGGLAYEEGTSEALLAKFYRLFLMTRRRHQLPPQSRDWFRNLMACLGESFKIRRASSRCDTSRHSFYKSGCSGPRSHNLGRTALLFWEGDPRSDTRGAARSRRGPSRFTVSVDADMP